jgi:ribosomal protein S7
MRLTQKFQKKTLYTSIITYITKKGNKELATKLVNAALLKATKKLKLGSQLILAIAFKNLNVCVEVKDVSRRGKIFKIPFPITLKRQRYLSIK